MNNQRDGHMRQTIYSDKTSYQPNSISGDDPAQAKAAEGGFTSYQERIDSKKVRERSKSFFDHFSQATLFFNSQSEPEKNHIVDALTFELGKVENPAIRVRMTGILTRVDKTLAARVAAGLGIPVPDQPAYPINHSVPADGNQKDYEPLPSKSRIQKSDALSMANTLKNSIKTRCIAILAADGVDDKSLAAMKDELEAGGAKTKIVAPKLGMIKGASGKEVKVDQTFLNTASVLFDAIYIPSGSQSANTLIGEAGAIHFINEAYKHCKAIAAAGDGVKVLQKSYVPVGEKKPGASPDPGLLIDKAPKDFMDAIAKHRVWEREAQRKVPA
jgi:catalase